LPEDDVLSFIILVLGPGVLVESALATLRRHGLAAVSCNFSGSCDAVVKGKRDQRDDCRLSMRLLVYIRPGTSAKAIAIALFVPKSHYICRFCRGKRGSFNRC